MERQLNRGDVPLIRQTVSFVATDGDLIRIAVGSRSHDLTSGRLVLATGLHYDVPAWVPTGAWGRTVFTCPFCHAHEHDGEPFVAVGKDVGTVDLALLCAVYARPLTVLVTDAEATVSEQADRIRALGGDVVYGAVETASADPSGRGLVLVTTAGKRYPAGAVLVVGVMKLRTGLTTQLGLRASELGIPETDDEGRSSNPRVWMAGTAARPHYMLAESIGSGTRVGISVHRDMCLAGL